MLLSKIHIYLVYLIFTDTIPDMLLRLTKKELAAIEAVMDIALNGGGGLVQSSDITERLDIPPRYLEPILQRLGRAGILVGIRGPSGGYRLARERRRITLADLVDAIRGEADADDPQPGMRRTEPSNTGIALSSALADLDRDIHARLRVVTIEDLCWRRDQQEKSTRRAGAPDFAI